MDYSILINSCDTYKDAWPMFFYILKKTWKTQLPDIYLNTETEYYYNENLNINVLNCKKMGVSWGGRLLDCLQKIDSEFVLMMLEDFYYEKPIRTDIVDLCVSYLKNNSQIICFQLVPSDEVFYGHPCGNEDYEGFIARRRFGMFKMIAGPTLWRKSDLIKLTKRQDSPWEWEYFGSYRTWLFGKKVYCWKSLDNPLFDYDIEHGGAIHRGKWVGYKVKELEEKYHYKNDYGNRAIEDDWIKYENKNVLQPRRKRVRSILFNRWKVVQEIFYGIKLRKYERIKRV